MILRFSGCLKVDIQRTLPKSQNEAGMDPDEATGLGNLRVPVSAIVGIAVIAGTSIFVPTLRSANTTATGGTS